MHNNIKEFLDYRDYLNAFFHQKKEAKSDYSLRAFARDLQISPGQLSKIFNHKNGLSLEKAQNVADNLGLEKESKSYFMDLVQAAHSKDPLIRKTAMERCTIKRRVPDFKVYQTDMYNIYTHWYYFALVEMTSLNNFNSDPLWISQKLGISAEEAKEALERLLRVQMITIRNGKYVKTNLNTDSPSGKSSEALKNVCEQTLDLAKAAVRRQKVESRSCSNIVMAIDKKQIPKAKQMIIEFKRKLSEVLESGKAEDIYCFSANLFSLTQQGDLQ